MWRKYQNSGVASGSVSWYGMAAVNISGVAGEISGGSMAASSVADVAARSCRSMAK